MNNLQLIDWAIRNGELTIHEPSFAYPFYTCTMEGKAVSDRDYQACLDMACDHLRGEALLVEASMAH